MHQGNLTFNPQLGPLPLAHIITRLLIRQELDFMPSINYQATDPSEIGRLIITSYFSVPSLGQTSFLIYKLITIPFLHENETLQLSHIPQHIAVEPLNNITIEWYEHDEVECNFNSMTTCRDTPPYRSLSNDTCIGQILGGYHLSKCFTSSVPPSPFFLKRLRDNLWVTSSSQPLHCVAIPRTEFPILSYQTASRNEQLILPPVALVNVTSGSTIACPGFSLTGRPVEQRAPSVVILYNNTQLLNNVSVLDVHRHLINSNAWSKQKFIGGQLKDILKLIERPLPSPNIDFTHPMYMSSTIMILIACLLIGATIFSIWYIRRCYPQHILKNTRVVLPPPPLQT